MNFKKIFAAILCIAMLLSLAACGSKTTTTPSNGTSQTFDADAKGMIFLGIGAEVKLSYDKEGLVTAADPANESGQELLGKCPIEVGTACATAITELIKAGLETSTSDLKTILIKQAFGSESPSNKFMEEIQAAAAEVAAGRTVVAVDVATLTGEGYLPEEAVKAIFLATIGDENANISITADLANGLYFVSSKTADITSNYTVDADNGVVTFQEDEPVAEVLPEEEEASDEFYEPEPETEYTDPYVEEPVTDPIFPDDITPPDGGEDTPV